MSPYAWLYEGVIKVYQLLSPLRSQLHLIYVASQWLAKSKSQNGYS